MKALPSAAITASARPYARLRTLMQIDLTVPSALTLRFSDQFYKPSTWFEAEALADAPTHYWRLGEAAGTTAADIGSSPQVGTYANSPTLGVAGLVTDDADTAVTFNGTTQYVSVGTIALPAVLTIEALIKTTEVGTRPIYTSTSGPQVYFGMTGGKLLFFVDPGGSVIGVATINDGLAHHVVVETDGVTVWLYVDGALDKTVAFSRGASAGDGSDIAHSGPNVQFWSGTLDEILLYAGKRLGEARVKAHADAARLATPEWLPFVSDWGDIEDALNVSDVGGRPATGTVTLLNTRPIQGKDRLSDLVKSPLNLSGTWEFVDAKVTVRQVFDGEPVVVTSAVLYIEDFPEVTAETLTLRLRDLAGLIEDRTVLGSVTLDLFPEADGDDVGKPISVAIGVLKDVPALAIVAGAHSTLAIGAAVTATVPGVGGTLTITDNGKFPNAGTLQIDDEQMTWTAKSGTTGLVVGQRGAAGTTATAHTDGANLFEVRSGAKAYRYLVGENLGAYKTKSATHIQVDGVAQPTSGATAPTIELDETTLIAGRSFVVLNFPAKPTLKRQTKLALDDALTVSDNITFNAAPSITTIKRAGTTPTTTFNVPGGPFSVSTTYSTISGTIISVFYSISWVVQVSASISSTVTWHVDVNGVEQGSVTGASSFISGTTTLNTTALQAIAVSVRFTGSGIVTGTVMIQITGSSADVTLAVTLTKSGAASRGGTISLAGNSTVDLVIGGLVTCDIEGLQDDASGTISGTPSLLLEHPADITKLALLSAYPGSSTSDIGVSFATTRSSLTRAGYKWAFLLEGQKFSQLRRRLGEQANSWLYLEGGQWQYSTLVTAPLKQYIDEFRPPIGAVPSAQRTQILSLGMTISTVGALTPSLTLDYLKDVSLTDRIKLERRGQLVTHLFAYSQRDYRESGGLGDRYRRLKTITDTTYHADKVKYELELDLIQDGATADAVATFWSRWWRRLRWHLELTGFWNAIAVEKVDLVALSNHPALTAHGGTTLIFRTRQKQLKMADEMTGKIALALVETNT